VAYHTVESIRKLLPRQGAGLPDEHVQTAIDTGIARTVIVTRDDLGNDPLGRTAAELFALGYLLGKLFPRDARSVLGREERSDPDVYIQQAKDLLEEFKLLHPEWFAVSTTDLTAPLYISVGKTPWLD
jgi:hypothetical protein